MYDLILLNPFSIQQADELGKLVDLLAEFPDLPNFSMLNWPENRASLMYKLVTGASYTTNRGGIFALSDGEKYLAISGFHRLEIEDGKWSDDVFVCGSRTLVRREYRHHLLVSTYLIPAQYQAVRKRQGKMMIFCFDSSEESSLYKIYKDGKFNLFLRNKLSNFDEIYGDMKIHDKPVYVNFTKHNVLYKKLDPNFEFDWSTIEVKDGA